MGRYYSGDIEGKFWFGVQSSDDASFFGGEECEPNYISYHFEKSDLKKVEEGIAKCIAELGDKKAILDGFFGEGGKGYQGYNDEMIAEEFGLEVKKDNNIYKYPEVSRALEWYARLKLGNKIHKCLLEQDYCDFDAEL